MLRHPGSAAARRLIDGWIASDCGAKDQQVVSKLLNRADDVGALATFYELIVGQALKALFGGADWEPTGLPCAGQPDWRVATANGPAVFEVRYLEEYMPESERRGRELFRRLAATVAPWVVVVDWNQCEHLETARVSVLSGQIRDRLSALVPGSGPHEIDLTHLGSRVVLTAFATGRSRSVIQTRARASWAPGIVQIRHGVEDKGRKYAGLKDAHIPYVIVLCSDDPLLDADALCTALFGDPSIRVVMSPGQPLVIQPGFLANSGTLTPKGAGPPSFTRVSAVWLLRTHFARTQWIAEIVSAANPWAANPFLWTDPRVASIDHQIDQSGVDFAMPNVVPQFSVR
jgi:hypothetical protein